MSTEWIAILTAAGVLVTAIGVVVSDVFLYLLNGKFDRLQGQVDALEKGHNAHVNTPGLHGAQR